jgi:hypothetical protein
VGAGVAAIETRFAVHPVRMEAQKRLSTIVEEARRIRIFPRCPLLGETLDIFYCDAP